MAKPVRRTGPKDDPTIYPEEDDVGEGALQRFISELLRAQIVRWLKARKVKAFVGANQFIYYVQHNPREAFAPDVYVMPGFAPELCPGSWKTWETGVAPSFAFECVSLDVQKDCYEAPRRSQDVGVGELVIFDPGYREGADRRRWHVYRRVGKRGLVLVETTNGDRVRSKALGCWLRAVEGAEGARVRVATGPTGDVLLLTAEEDADAERAAKEQERAAREAAEAELLSLRAEIARLKKRK